MNRFFIIVNGPTGSGKGSLPDKIIDDLQLKNEYRITRIIIDDIIEKQQTYKNEIDNLLELSSKICKKVNLDNINNNLTGFIDEILGNNEKLQKLSDIYFKVRHSKCQEFNGTCEEYNNKLLNIAINNGDNIVLESVGIKFPDWLFDLYFDKLINYNIIIAYSVVNSCELLSRNIKRFMTALKNYCKDKTLPTPRLPNIKKDIYKLQLKQIIETLKKNIYQKTYIEKNKNKIKIRYLIYNNNKTHILKFDSNSNNINHMDSINLYETNQINECAFIKGGYNKTYKTTKYKKTKKTKKK